VPSGLLQPLRIAHERLTFEVCARLGYTLNIQKRDSGFGTGISSGRRSAPAGNRNGGAGSAGCYARIGRHGAQLIAIELEVIGPLRRAKTFLSLVAGIRQWAASLNASHSFIHVTTGTNLAATDRLMTAAGAKCIGGAYVV
jgi:hypothetical protein